MSSDIHSPVDKLDPVSHATWMRIAIAKYGLTPEEAEIALAKVKRLGKGYGHIFDTICLEIKREREEHGP